VNSNPRNEWLNRKPGGLATRLKKMMEAAPFLTARAFGVAAGMHPSKVSRIANGETFPEDDDIRVWVATAGGTEAEAAELVALAAEGRTLWADLKRILREGIAEAQNDVNERIARSSTIAYFETTVIPGPLQTAGYAEALLRLLAPGMGEDDMAAAIAERVRRWEALHDRSKRWELLLTEPVLHMWPGEDGERVMRVQLDRILGLLGLPNVRIGVIPMRRCLTEAWPYSSFALYDDSAMVELLTGAQTLSGEAAAEYRGWLDRLWPEAVEDVDELGEMIARAAP
jgi:hypothetical protein